MILFGLLCFACGMLVQRWIDTPTTLVRSAENLARGKK